MRTLIVFAVLLALLQACSADTAKRLTYESVQTMRQQECNKDLTTPCPPRQSYNDYQTKREEATKNKDQKADSNPSQ